MPACSRALPEIGARREWQGLAITEGTTNGDCECCVAVDLHRCARCGIDVEGDCALRHTLDDLAHLGVGGDLDGLRRRVPVAEGDMAQPIPLAVVRVERCVQTGVSCIAARIVVDVCAWPALDDHLEHRTGARPVEGWPGVAVQDVGNGEVGAVDACGHGLHFVLVVLVGTGWVETVLADQERAGDSRLPATHAIVPGPDGARPHLDAASPIGLGIEGVAESVVVRSVESAAIDLHP